MKMFEDNLEKEKSDSTREAVETAIDLSKDPHGGTWEKQVKKLRPLKRWESTDSKVRRTA